MLSPLTEERIIAPANLFYCDCRHDCVDSFMLPALVGKMLMTDITLMLLVGGHKSDQAGEVVKRGKGWKVCRVKSTGGTGKAL